MSAKSLGRFALLLGMEALAACISILFIPSESGSSLLLGLSAARLALLALMLLLAATGMDLFWLSWKAHPLVERIRRSVHAALNNRRLYPVIIAGVIALTAASLLVLLLTFRFTDAALRAPLVRLSPLTGWIFLAGAQALAFLPKWRDASFDSQTIRASLAPTLWALAGLGVLSWLVGATGLGLQPDRTGWDSPGTPILDTQVGMALLAAVGLVGLGAWLARRLGWTLTRIDRAAMALIWLAAVLLWQSQPLTPTYFSPTPRPPNFEFYPYSDAAGHDLDGQSLLIGEGFDGPVEKPAYSAFLAFVHALVGQEYTAVVNAQILLLALFPVFLYAIGTRLHSRLAGGLLAAMVILRERNAIALSGEINVSHSKLLMTDLPAALALAALTLLLLRWAQDKRPRLIWPLWTGAALGLILLLRSQSIIFLPLLLLMAQVHADTRRRRGLQVGLVLLGFGLAALPWLFRNYLESGTFGYAQPYQMYYMATQYSLHPEDNDPGFPADAQVDDYVDLGSARVATFVRQHPGEVLRFMTAHTLHNEVSALLALPMRFDFIDRLVIYQGLLPFWPERQVELWERCCSLDRYIEVAPYWEAWDGRFPPEAYGPLALNLFLVALGLGVAWHRVGWPGLLPLAVHLGYSLSTAIARVSGWRLILPVDWILLLYYSLGLAQIAWWAWLYLGGRRRLFADPPHTQSRQGATRQTLLTHAALIVCLGLLIPLSEAVIPARYQPIDSPQAIQMWEENAAGTAFDVADFLQQPGAEVLVGRALYPRYYRAGQGEPGGEWAAFNPLPFSRLGFVLLGPRDNHVILPWMGTPPALPNGADVVVYGCQAEGYFRAAALLINGTATVPWVSNTHPAWVCP